LPVSLLYLDLQQLARTLEGPPPMTDPVFLGQGEFGKGFAG